MKKLNSYIPFWFLLIMPPLLPFLLIFNLAMSGIGILATALFLKIKNPFDEYYKNTLKIFFITLKPTFFISVMYLLPQLLRNIDCIYDNFIYHLEYNPYKNIFSFLYMILIFVGSCYITYKTVNKKIIRKLDRDEETKIQANILLTMFLIPYILLIPSTMLIKPNKSNLDDFYGTIMKDDKTINELIKKLAISENITSYFLETKKEPYTMHIYVEDIKEYRKSFEMDASIMFYLIKDINEIKYHMNEQSYTYTINDINDIYGNVEKKELLEINERYTNKEMKEYHYLGRLSEYDVFNKKKETKQLPQLLINYKETNYYIECSDINNIIAIKNGKYYKLIDLFKNKKIRIDDLAKSQLEFIVTGEVEDENIN